MSRVNQLTINLKSVSLEDELLTADQLAHRLMVSYTSMLISIPQVLAVFGSMDALGNPKEFFNGIGTGVRDLFQQPMQGVRNRDVLQVGQGVFRGTKSLVSHTMSGVGHEVSVLTKGFGSTAAALTFDSKFKASRQERLKDQPTTIMGGLHTGMKSIGSGLVGGVVGLVERPKEGLKKEGAMGLAKGMGKGFAGLISKPISGIADAISLTSRGVEQQISTSRNSNKKSEDDVKK